MIRLHLRLGRFALRTAPPIADFLDFRAIARGAQSAPTTAAIPQGSVDANVLPARTTATATAAAAAAAAGVSPAASIATDNGTRLRAAPQRFDPRRRDIDGGCPAGWDACGTARCHFLPMAHAHRGSCGVACRPDQLCSHGRCV